jgi:gliding motility-associated-like protein
MSPSLPKIIIVTGLIFSLGSFAYAQESVHASGGDAQGVGGSVAFSVGQVVFTTHSSSTGIEAQGVQQRYEMAKVAFALEEAQLTTPWSKTPNLPSYVNIQTTEGQFIRVGVTWKTSPLNVYKRGTYTLSGSLVLPSYVANPSQVNAQLQIQVLPKAPPRDVNLTNSSFLGKSQTFFIPVGAFVVDDPLDNIHSIQLWGEGYDNALFEVKNNILFWSTANPAPGRKNFTLLVRVTDRDGNTLEKFFEIQRTYPETSDLEISNTFTPNGDGVNDTWGVPDLRFYQNVRIQIFDRGGLLVFSSESPDVRWDGSQKGKDLPIGTYYWVITIGETGETRRGMLNLLRK